MNLHMDRRDFLKSAAMFSALGLAPQFLTRTVDAATQSIRGFADDRVLVVVQLGGGNDGLNACVPWSDDAYYRARPQIGVRKDSLIRVTDDLAFNSSMKDMKALYDDGKLAVIQGVGYPNPDRSHFRSMEIWETASDSDEYLGTGWIGRYFDHACSGTARPQAGVALGKERPQSFEGEKGFGVAFEDPRRFGWQPGNGADSLENFARLNAPTGKGQSNLDFLRHVTSNAIMSSEEVKQAAERAGLDLKGGQYFARQLDIVRDLIKGGLDTRIYYVSASGFDTHANQRGQHDNLLRQVSESLGQFQTGLEREGLSSRVTTVVFSEFGRRVSENKSGGTDHGTAAPMFVIGDNVKPGLFGEAPSLQRLDDGDLIHTVDFRQVYAAVLEDWLGVSAKAVLGEAFAPLPVIA